MHFYMLNYTLKTTGLRCAWCGLHIQEINTGLISLSTSLSKTTKHQACFDPVT